MSTARAREELGPRLEAVAERLRGLSKEPSPTGLTEPDDPSGEQWEWGQVWAHTAEFPGYWLDQIDRVLATATDGPVPFGRVRTDPGRNGAIERDRGTPPPELMARIEAQLERLRAAIEAYTAGDWTRRFAHSTLGEMNLTAVLDTFLVGHLESHADQLDGLLRGEE